MITDDQLDLANAEALDILDADEARAIAQLRAGNDVAVITDFETAVRQAQETLSILSLTTFGPPPARLRQQILEQIADEQRNTGAAKHRADDLQSPISLADRRSRASRWQLGVGSVAAAVALLVGGAFAGYELRGTSPSTTQEASATDRILASSDARTVSAEMATGGTVTALYSKQADAAVLMLNSMPKPSAEKVYQMWFVTGSNAPVSAGILTAERMSDKSTIELTNVKDVSTLAFSVEPPGGSPQPTTTPFAAINLT